MMRTDTPDKNTQKKGTWRSYLFVLLLDLLALVANQLEIGRAHV